MEHSLKTSIKKTAKVIAYNIQNYLKSGVFVKEFHAKSFPKVSDNLPWLDRPNARELINKKLQRGILSPNEAEHLKSFSENGFTVLKAAVDPATIDRAEIALWKAIDEGRIEGLDRRYETLKESRRLDLHKLVPELNFLFRHPAILKIHEQIFEREVIPFQSLNFYYSSQQAPHSDAIHMTTYPLGFMAAAWIAMEDIHPDSGPLSYYPGSHKLPYVFSHDVGIDDQEYVAIGRSSYNDKYENRIAEIIAGHNLKAEIFLPKKGDVLIWHHNLIHAGTSIKDPQKTRRAFVCHNFAKDVVCYHDLIGEPAKLEV